MVADPRIAQGLSFFFDFTGRFLPAAGLNSELLSPNLSYETTQNFNSEPQNIEYRTAECRRVESLRSVFFKIDRIPYFDIRYSLFDIRYSLFQSFFSDQTGCPLAGGRARMKLQ